MSHHAGARGSWKYSTSPFRNSQCTINVPQTTVNLASGVLTLNASITFDPTFVGTLSIQPLVNDTAGLSIGPSSSYVAFAPNPAPPTVSFQVPPPGYGSTIPSLVLQASDPNGAKYIRWAEISYCCDSFGAYLLTYYDANSGIAYTEDSQGGPMFGGPQSFGVSRSGNTLTASALNINFAGFLDSQGGAVVCGTLCPMQSAAGDPTGGVLGGSGNWWAGDVEITSPYPGSINATSLAGAGTIALAANASTQWIATVQNQQTWIHIVSGSSGTGSASVSYTYDANQTGSQRQGCIFVDDINDIANNGGGLGGNVCINQSADQTISTVSPASAPVGTAVTISGINFGASQGASTVTFGGLSAGAALSWSPISITVTVPTAAVTGPLVVTINGTSSNGVPFTVIPSISTVSPPSGAAGTQVILSGTGFGPTRGVGMVWLGSTPGTVVSWTNTQITATVASNAASGTARVQQSGAWSNSVPFTISTATISSINPTSGVAGTQVTVTGSGFGASQGSGQVWLGTAAGVVQSWSDTQVIAQVASGAASGYAQILQNGVLSDGLPFTVNTLKITGINPTAGTSGTQVTITGTAFGTAQGSGTVMIGGAVSTIASWTDTQIVAVVAPSALTGPLRVQQNGAWSGALEFTVLGAGPASKLVPHVINLAVGDTHTIQALNSSNQPMTGLTWTSSDPTVVSLSTDDPPVLTALAIGHVTIAAGGASADVTVSPTLSPGTIAWSNPGDGSGVYKIMPAVPSPTGIADVFAWQNDGSIQAITADGTTAWTATTTDYLIDALPDFQGGVIAVYQRRDNTGYMTKLDGLTGQPSPSSNPFNGSTPVVHPDGTILGIHEGADPLSKSLTGIDPTTGTTKFTIALPVPSCSPSDVGHTCNFAYRGPIVAGDGYAYVGAFLSDSSGMRLVAVRADTSGGSVQTPVKQWNVPYYGGNTVAQELITNADQGIVLTWWADWAPDPSRWWVLAPADIGMATINGTSVSLFNGPSLPGQAEDRQSAVVPLLQAEDGTFVGNVFVVTSAGETQPMVAFDAGGNIRWSVAGDWEPEIATADGGVIALNWDTGAYVTFDQNGNTTGQMAGLPIQSWTMNEYQADTISQVLANPVLFALSFWPFNGANPSHTATAPFPIDSVTNARVSALTFQQFDPSDGPYQTEVSQPNWPVRAHDSTSNSQVNGILNPTRWRNFAPTHCASLFGDPVQGIAKDVYGYSLAGAQYKQRGGLTNYYDLSNPGVASLLVYDVTAHETPKTPQTLAQYIQNANAATVNMGASKHTAVILSVGFFKQTVPVRFALMHETLLHAYGNWWDDPIYANPLFIQNGLRRFATETTTVSTWMSTDCKCTPDPANPGACPANTAKW